VIKAIEMQTGKDLTNVGNVPYNRVHNILYLKLESYELTEAEEQQRLDFCFDIINQALDGTIILREIIDLALLVIREAVK